MRGRTAILGFATALVGCFASCASQVPASGQQGGGAAGGGGGWAGDGSAGAGLGGTTSGSAGSTGPGGVGGASGGGPGSGGLTGVGTGGGHPIGGTGGEAGTSGVAGAAGSGRGGSTGGMPDAGLDAKIEKDASPGSGCAGLFCEDFEKGAIDPAIWDLKVNGGQAPPNLVTQAGLVAHGKYAAHFHATPNTVSYDFMITKNPPAALKGHHFGRAYFMITPMPPTNHTEYIYAGTTGFPQLKYLEVASAAPLVWQLTYVDLVPPGTGEDYHSGGKLPIGKWFCLEWEFNDAPDQAAVYLDGNATAAFAQNTFTFNGVTADLVGGFAAFGFGYYVWHPATYAFDVYYDDIVLDTKRVGCLD
jgi:hypothetical protein